MGEGCLGAVFPDFCNCHVVEEIQDEFAQRWCRSHHAAINRAYNGLGGYIDIDRNVIVDGIKRPLRVVRFSDAFLCKPLADPEVPFQLLFGQRLGRPRRVLGGGLAGRAQRHQQHESCPKPSGHHGKPHRGMF
jgi:hypothetical protein